MSTKTLESLELAVAQKSLDEYSAALAESDGKSIKAVACRRRVQQGIDAFGWIVRAEETIRQAAYQGLIDFSQELDATLEALYRGWLARRGQMQALIRQQILQGAEFDNVQEFAKCRDSALDWIERHEWTKASERSRQRRFASEPW